MPPAANESQGLKIAVAAFVSLTVILAVTTYFMYSNYSQASSQLTKAQEDLRTESKAKGIALEQYQQLRDALGYTTLEDHEAVKAAMKKDRDDILRQVNDIAREVSDAVGKAQQGGEADPKFEELRSTAQGLVAAYAQEPSSYKDSMIRITNLLGNLSALSTAFATNDVALRQSLTSANAVNSERLAQQSGGFEKSKQDLESTHVQHEKERAQLMAAVDDAQTRLRQLSTDLAQLQSRYDRDTEKLNRDLTLARAIGREARDQMAKTDVVLDRADGKVLGVDFSTNTVRLDLTKGQGAKPQMKFSIFDRNSPGLPTESPKARVELISVSDRDSVARIETGREVEKGKEKKKIIKKRKVKKVQ